MLPKIFKSTSCYIQNNRFPKSNIVLAMSPCRVHESSKKSDSAAIVFEGKVEVIDSVACRKLECSSGTSSHLEASLDSANSPQLENACETECPSKFCRPCSPCAILIHIQRQDLVEA